MTMDELQAHLVSGELPGYYRRPAKHLRCADGLKLSVQAGNLHYCTPRNNAGPYTAVEVGYPTRVVPEFAEYAEDADKLTDTVYPQVPAHLVLEVINTHGGVAP
jgi:hypothetical protein